MSTKEKRRLGWPTRVRVALAGALALSGALVAVASVPAPASAEPCGPQGNEIACENSKPGTDPAIWDIQGSGASDIQGFATDMSVNVGSRIDFKVDTDAAAYNVDIYRTGWYGGDGARLIDSITPSATLPQTQPACITEAQTGLYDCGNWSVSASWNVPATAVSGVYVAKLTRSDNQNTSHIIFVVRDDASDSDVLFQTSDPTWQAYNTYGGSSFYTGGSAGRAFKLSYNRPFATRGGVNGRDFYFSGEYAMVRFLERNGYDLSYTSGLDTDRRGQLIQNHGTFLSVGHDEYWSGAQRSNVEAARGAGVNMLFAAGNEAYWRTRWEASADASATPYRTLVSYKETWSNAKIDPSPEWTGTWRDPRFAPPSAGGGRPENAVTGTMYMVNDSDLPLTVTRTEGKFRMWRNTPLATMSTDAQELAPHTVGYESNEDLDNGFRPEGLIRLSTTVGNVPQYITEFGNRVTPGVTTHNTTLFKAPSGALVWSSGSIQWAWGLDQTHDGNGAPADSRMQQAQVNLLADMGAQPTTLMPGLTAASASTDTAAPTAAIDTPGAGNVANGVEVTATGTATDSGGGVVAGVEVSTDGGQTWHPATGTTSWSYSYVQHGRGSTPLKARAIDDSANIGQPATVARDVTCPCSVYGAKAPSLSDSLDPSPVELGLRFSPTTDGFVSGVRFYKSAANTGTHTGSLWSSAGVRLATVTFGNETAAGWQTATFSSPVEVTAGSTYVVSYTAPNGRYAMEANAYLYAGVTEPPLSVAGGYGAPAAGVYGNPGSFPAQSYKSSVYYVDALFVGSDSSPLGVVDRWPAASSGSVPVNTPISARFTKPIQQNTLQATVTDQLGQPVAGSTAYAPTTRTVTFTPDAPLAGFVTYTVALQAQDEQGQPIASDGTWSFRTAKPDPAPGVCPCSLFSESLTPGVLEANDPDAVTLGVRFSPTANGTVTGLSFYKGPNNGGSHVGSLWRADGVKLAEATYQNELASGWQYVTFSEPVPVTKNTEYVAAYRAPNGRYSFTPGALGSALDKTPLLAPASAGSYTYGAGFPGERSSSNYLVDVSFEPATPQIEITSQDPAPGAVDVPRTSAVNVSFSEAITTGYSMGLSIGGQPVSGTATLSGDARTLSFTHPTRFPAGATVDVSLSGVTSVEGATMPTQQWSFTTSSTSITAQTLFGNTVPAITANNDNSPVELGVAFSPTRNGKVTQIRFYKGSGNGGTHTGSLWTATGQLLASVVFTNETELGWQVATLANPVDLTAGTEYVVSYNAPQGRYSSTPDFFDQPWTSGDLTVPATTNGRYLYGSGGFPLYSFRATNYFVDVTFQPDPVQLAVTNRSPAPGATGVGTGTEVSISFNAALDDGYSMSLAAGASSLPGSTVLSADRKTLTFTPSSALPASTAVDVTVGGLVSLEGSNVATQAWSFTTGSTSQGSNVTLLGNATPTVAAANDTDPIELGMAFTTSEPGSVTAIRFYKGTGNGGTHVGSLWTSSGTLLGQVTFGGESATGWQTAQLSSPVELTPGQTYVVSYLAPQGRYSLTGGFFTAPVTSGPLTAPASDNGRYRYGAVGGFPTSSWNASNYYVDVVFRPASG